jgi:hypothetical protein
MGESASNQFITREMRLRATLDRKNACLRKVYAINKKVKVKDLTELGQKTKNRGTGPKNNKRNLPQAEPSSLHSTQNIESASMQPTQPMSEFNIEDDDCCDMFLHSKFFPTNYFFAF